MATNEIITKLTELAELRRMAEELNAEIDAIQDAIKAHITEADTDTITAGAFKVTWTPYTTSRFDSTRFKKEHADLAAAYTKTTTIRRFSVR